MTDLTPNSKGDGGKPMVGSLVLAYFPRALIAVAEVSMYGMEKYNAKPEDMGFLAVENGRRRYGDAMIRHVLLEGIEGPINEEDGGLYHDAQAAWGALARLEMRLIEGENVASAGLPWVGRRPNPVPQK